MIARARAAWRTFWGWTPGTPDPGWTGGGRGAVSGVSVNGQSALTYAPWWQGINLVSADVARVPCPVYRYTDSTFTNRQRDRSHPVDALLNVRANDIMDAFTMRETLQAHAMSWGNGYAGIVRSRGRISLVPMMPDRVRPKLVKLSGATARELGVDGSTELVYEHTMDSGDKPVYMARDVFHVKGLSWGGLCGYSVFSLARESLGLGLTAEQHSNAHLANGARPDVVIKVPAKMDEAASALLLSSWEARQQGAANRKRPALIGPEMDVTPFPVSNEDAQLLETRKFQRVDVASWLGIPPHKLGDDSRLSYNSIEAENRAYLNTALAKWYRKWKAEVELKLLEGDSRRFVEHNTAALLQGDFLSTLQGLQVGIQSTIYSPNEARQVLNLNSREGGDVYANSNTTSNATAAASESRISEAHRALVADRARKLVTLEVERATRAARKPAEFLAWIDRFYGETFAATMQRELGPVVDAVSSLTASTGDVQSVITSYVAESRELLMTVAGNCCYDDLAKSVAATVGTWQTRAENITASILDPER